MKAGECTNLTCRCWDKILQPAFMKQRLDHGLLFSRRKLLSAARAAPLPEQHIRRPFSALLDRPPSSPLPPPVPSLPELRLPSAQLLPDAAQRPSRPVRRQGGNHQGLAAQALDPDPQLRLERINGFAGALHVPLHD